MTAARPLFSVPDQTYDGVETVDGYLIPLDQNAVHAFAEWAHYWNTRAGEFAARYAETRSMEGASALEAEVGFLGTLIGARQALGHSLSATAAILEHATSPQIALNMTADPVLAIPLYGNSTAGQLRRAAARILTDVDRYLKTRAECAAGREACRTSVVEGTVPDLGGCDGVRFASDGAWMPVAYREDGTEMVCVPVSPMGRTGMGVAPAALLAAAPFVVQLIGYTIAAVVVLRMYRMSLDVLSQYFGINAELLEEAAEAAQVAYDAAVVACHQLTDPEERRRCIGGASQEYIDALARINEDYQGSAGRVMSMLLTVGVLGLGAYAISQR